MSGSGQHDAGIVVRWAGRSRSESKTGKYYRSMTPVSRGKFAGAIDRESWDGITYRRTVNRGLLKVWEQSSNVEMRINVSNSSTVIFIVRFFIYVCLLNSVNPPNCIEVH